MPYIPTLADIPQTKNNASSGYTPTLADIPATNNVVSRETGNPNLFGTGQSLATLSGKTPFNRISADINTGLERAVGGLGSMIDPSSQLMQKLQSANQAVNQGYPQNFGDKLVTGAASYAPYLAGGEAIPVLRGLIGAPGIVKNLGIDALYGASQDPNNRAEGAGISGLLSGLTAGASTAVSGLLKKTLLNRIANQAGALTQAGERVNPTLRTPEEVESLTKSMGNAPITLGQATNHPIVKNVESTLSYIPGSGIGKAQQGALNATTDMSSNLLNSLSGDAKSGADLTTNVQSGLNSLHDQQQQIMQKGYEPINDLADELGLKITERPNLQATVDKYIGDNNDALAKGITMQPEVSNLEKSSLQNIANPQNNDVSFSEMRGLESQLKQKARDYASGGDPNYEKQQMYNDLANSVRLDYEHNALNSGVPGFKDMMDSANANAKSQYYDLFGNSGMQKAINGQLSPNQLYNTLTNSPLGLKVASLLPQNIKNNLYMMGLSQLKEGEEGLDMSPQNLVNNIRKGNAKNSGIKNVLLDQPTQQAVNGLQDALDATQDQRVLAAKVPTGMTLRGPIKTSLTGLGAFGGAHALGLSNLGMAIGAIPTMGAARLLAKSLSSPKTIQQYINIGKSGANPTIKNAYNAGRAAIMPTSNALLNNQ